MVIIVHLNLVPLEVLFEIDWMSQPQITLTWVQKLYFDASQKKGEEVKGIDGFLSTRWLRAMVYFQESMFFRWEKRIYEIDTQKVDESIRSQCWLNFLDVLMPQR